MRTSSRKAKGNRLTNWVRDKLIAILGIDGELIKVAVGGENGVDVRLFADAKRTFPYAPECKNQERINIWQSWDQCKTNAAEEGLEPALFFKRNRSDVLVVLDAEHFLGLIAKLPG